MIFPFPSGIAAAIAIAALGLSTGENEPITALIADTVHCAEGRSFSVQLAPDRAVVIAEGKRWTLRRVPSDMFVRYTSEDAAFVIDADFVALVLTGDLSFKECHLPRQN